MAIFIVLFLLCLLKDNIICASVYIMLLLQSDGKTPLMLSVQHGFGEIIEFLLSCEANVLIADNNGHIAVDTIKGSPKALKYLREETMVC